MRKRIWKQGITMCLMVAGSAIFWSCGQERMPLKAKVEVAHQSIYVWNTGDRAWTGGVAYLNDRSLNISKSFGTVKPGGFAQLPLREFRHGDKSVLESGLEIRSVCVAVEGYDREKFMVSWKGQ